MTDDGYERIASLLGALPPAPRAWVRAAQQLPRYRAELDEVAARVEADARFRDALVADLESALAAAGYDCDTSFVAAVRARLSP